MICEHEHCKREIDARVAHEVHLVIDGRAVQVTTLCDACVIEVHDWHEGQKLRPELAPLPEGS